jgi:hypothetical protein
MSIDSGSSVLSCPSSDLSESQQLDLGDYRDRILCFAVSPCRTLLATCDDEKRLLIWKVEGQTCSLGKSHIFLL